MNIAVGAGDMVSFYVAQTNGTSHNYINGSTEGALWASDANLEIYEGVGKGGPAVFSGGTFRPRNFSGNIVYDFGTPPSTSLDFTCADVGVNTVQVTATDESGNTATCMADITVVDDIAPIVVCIGEQLTGPNTVSDSPGIAIVDNTTFSTTITIPDSFTMNDVNMNIDIEHTWTGDITLTLEHPDGTQVIVFDDADGCSGDNMFDTYDDESLNPLDCQAGTGDAFPLDDYIPSNPLAAFDGKDSAGVWTLFVEDDAGGDTGILNSWGITYDFDPIVATPLEVDLDANGMATINATDLLLSVDEACGWTATVGGAPTPQTLETTFVGGNGNFGNMFDMNALTDVTLQSFDIHGDNGAVFDVEVYAKAGTYVGFETDPGAWTLIGTAPGVVSNGDGLATPLNLALGYAMAAGETHAFYVTPTDFSTGGFNYTNGNAVGDVFASDANIEFLEGSGSGYPFNGTLFSPRVWNGNIIYDAGSGMSTTLDLDCSNLGENLIEVTVTDDSGNVGTCFATVNVNDVTDPILICMDVTIELDENGEATIDPEALLAVMPGTFEVITISSDNQSGAVGNTDFTVPVTAADNLTFDWIYNTDDGAAFDTFGYLLNGVFTELVDPAGGNSQMGSAGPIAVAPGDVFGFRSASVDGLFGPSTTVISNFQPGFTGQFEPANWTLTLDNSDGDAFFVEIPGGPLSFDACGIETLGLDIFELTCDDIANSPITVTVFASDSSGNLASCTSQVTVVDLLAPIVTCPDDVTVDPGVGNLFWEVEDYFALGTASATDNCTDPLTIFSQDPAPGTLLPDGVYTITMSAEDEYGNVGTCTFELTVESILGVDDNGLGDGIAIFPNPTDSQVTISNATGIQLEKVAIYDVNGRLINTIDLSDMQQEKTIDVSQLATGVYMLQIQSENESTVKRLVKE
jgi:subtilisin-like proprotein convertase family protein